MFHILHGVPTLKCLLKYAAMSPNNLEVSNKRVVFTAMEERVLAQEVVKYNDIINGSFNTSGTTNAKKTETWQNITAAVNAVGTGDKSMENIKKKYNNMKERAKKLAANRRVVCQAGGGETEVKPLTEIQKIMATVRPPVCIQSVPGGVTDHLEDSPVITGLMDQLDCTPALLPVDSMVSLDNASNEVIGSANPPEARRSPETTSDPSECTTPRPSSSALPGAQMKKGIKRKTSSEGPNYSGSHEDLLQQEVNLMKVKVEHLKGKNDIGRHTNSLLEHILICLAVAYEVDMP